MVRPLVGPKRPKIRCCVEQLNRIFTNMQYLRDSADLKNRYGNLSKKRTIRDNFPRLVVFLAVNFRKKIPNKSQNETMYKVGTVSETF